MIQLQSYFGDYFIVDEIASGGMASICLAYDLKKFSFVALKTLFSQYRNDPVFLKRLQREGDIYKSLKHPNIIELLDSSFSGSVPYLILEYIHGETLAGLIARNPDGCKLRIALRVMEDIIGSLVQAHAKSIIHRDLQPQNVLIDGSGVVKLFDFGIAYAEDDLVRTITGTIMGTILYASPEQSEGKEVDERADLYSLGLLFYELLTGKKAVEGADLGEVLEKKLGNKIIPPCELREDLPPYLGKMTMKLLNKDPDKRYRSIGALFEELIDLRCNLDNKERKLLFGGELERKLYEAKKHFAAGRYEAALENAGAYAEGVPKRAKRRFDFLYLLARLNRAMGENEEAEKYFETLLSLPTARNEHLLDFATFMHSLGRIDDALEALAPFTEGAPLGAPALALRRVIEDSKKDNQAAAQILDGMDDGDLPGLMEPDFEGKAKEGAASAQEEKPDGVELEGAGKQSSGQAGGDTSGIEGRGKGWRGAIRSWLFKAMNKKED